MSVKKMPLSVGTEDASTLPGRTDAIVHLGSICPANTSVKVLLSSNVIFLMKTNIETTTTRKQNKKMRAIVVLKDFLL